MTSATKLVGETHEPPINPVNFGFAKTAIKITYKANIATDKQT